MNKKNIAISSKLILNGSVLKQAEALQMIIKDDSFKDYSQAELTNAFDNIFDQLKEVKAEYYSIYYSNFRERFVEQLKEFPEVDCEGKPIISWVETMLENVKELFPEEKINENYRIILENKDRMENDIPEYCYPPVISPDCEWLVFHSKEDKHNFWIYDKKGNLIRHFIAPEEFRSLTISPNGERLVFRGSCFKKNRNSIIYDNYWLYDKNCNFLHQFIISADYHTPRFSPDNNWLAFLDHREYDNCLIINLENNECLTHGETIDFIKNNNIRKWKKDE